jgi:hypothetical protein
MLRRLGFACALGLLVVAPGAAADQRNLVEQGTGSEFLTGCTGAAAELGVPLSQVVGRVHPDQLFSGKCTAHFTGTVQGRPLANASYEGDIVINFNKEFPNGQGGFCWPFKGDITIANRAGTTSFDEHVTGKVCEVGADADPTAVTFAGTYKVTGGTGSLAGATGNGRLSINDSAENQDFWFQVGHIVTP